MLAASNFTDLYKTTLSRVMSNGQDVAPRGKKTAELRGVTLTLENPRRNILRSPARKLNYQFSVAEWLWMMLGRNDVATIGRYNKQIAQFSDDGVTFAGAYGPKLIEQLPYVIKTLQQDADSRQAVMTLWRERPSGSKDVPCTTLFQFFVRDGRLEMHTYMRSNDAWLGLPYDLFNFTMIQNFVAAQLGCDLGEYRHIVGSLHLYEEHWSKVTAVIAEDMSGCDTSPYLPPGPVPLEIEHMFLYLSSPSFVDWGTDVDSAASYIYGSIDAFQGPHVIWKNYLKVLASRTVRGFDQLPEPYRTLITEVGR